MIIAGYPAIGKTTYASERTDVLDMSLVLNFVGKDLIDAQLDQISVKAAYTGELLDAKKADGTPYEDGNRHLNRVGLSGIVVFLDGVFPDCPTIAFFITGTGHLRTSPGEVYRSTGPEGGMVTIHTENALYTWRIDSAIPQEKYQGLAERFIFRHDGYR